MKITAIELYHVSIPLRVTFWPTWIPGYPQTHNRFTLIKLLKKYGKRFFKMTATRLKFKVIREKGLKAALDLKKRKEGQAG